MAMGNEVLMNLGRTKDGCYVLACDSQIEPYRLVRDYDPSKEIGNQWSYTVVACGNINDAAEKIVNRNKPISYARLDEIATKMLHFLEDNDLLEDALYDTDTEMEDDEVEYFGIMGTGSED